MELPASIDLTFTAPIGVDVKSEIWSCVEVPRSAEFFDTQRAVRVDATIDEVPLAPGGRAK